MESFINIILILVGIYLLVGFFAAIYLVFFKLSSLDDASKDTSLGFKLLILPGMIVFYPLFLKRLKKAN